MESILEFFIYLFTDTIIGVQQTKKDSKGLRLFVLILLVIVMFLLFGLAFIYRNNSALVWAFLIFACLIALLLGKLWIKVIKIKEE